MFAITYRFFTFYAFLMNDTILTVFILFSSFFIYLIYSYKLIKLIFQIYLLYLQKNGICKIQYYS